MAFEVLIHSDDLGATPVSSQRILETWSAGALDGFSILPNGDCLPQVKKYLDAHPDQKARIAVHLNLIEGPLVAFGEATKPLADANGIFKWSFGKFFLNWLKGPAAEPALLGAIETEWRMQIRKVKELVHPRAVDVLDSHQHVHMIPSLFRIAVQLAKEEKIPEVRMTREKFSFSSVSDLARPKFLINVIKYFLLRCLALPNFREAARQNIRHPDSVLGVLYSGQMNAENVRAGLRSARRKGMRRVEVICHVGQVQANEIQPAKAAVEDPFYSSEFREIERTEMLKLRPHLND